MKITTWAIPALVVSMAVAVSACSQSDAPAPKPAMPTKAEIVAVVSASQDYAAHQAAFVTATTKLLRRGRCTLKQFKYWGGWTHSTSHGNGPVYFTYCGRGVSNRIYLDASSGRIFK